MTHPLSLAMRGCSVQPKDRIFVKGYRLLFFVRNTGKNVGKSISENLSSKYSQKLLDHAKESATHALQTALITAIHKTAEAIKLLAELRKFQKLHQIIIQK